MSIDRKGLKADQVYELLKKKIITHEIKPMEPLSERKLSTILDASRTPIHLAIQQLKKEKFINHTSDFGAYAAPITYELIQETYEVREVLEGLSARLCAQTLTDQQKEDLKKIFDKMTNALAELRYEEATAYDIEFHGFILSWCRNQMLSDLVHTVFEHSQRITRLTEYGPEWKKTVQQQHQNIFYAILEGRKDEAEKNMKIHIASSKERQLAQITR